MADKNAYSIEVLDVALDVIEELADSGKETKRPSEIAIKLGINRTRVYRILKSLSHRGYVDSDASGQGYMLGLKFLEIGTKIREQIDLRLLARPILPQTCPNIRRRRPPARSIPPGSHLHRFFPG